MSRTKLFANALALIGILSILSGFAIATAVAVQNTISLPSVISGVVVNARGPVAGAVVQVKGTPNTAEADENGVFTLSEMEGTYPIILVAWSAGHYVGWVMLDPDAPDWDESQEISITLQPLPASDFSEYEWYSFEGVDGSAGCGLCHREYPEWQADQHSQAAVNPRFISMYTGTNIHGEQGQFIEIGLDGIPQPIDPNLPYYGSGFRLDNPSRAGNCATCHTPMASTAPNTQNCAWSGCHTSLTIDRAQGYIAQPPLPPQSLRGDAAEGISCEFCHKIGEVYLDRETNVPHPDMPGILSYRLYRPRDESQDVLFGTLIDVTRQDSYLPLLSQSEFCAGCHYGVFGGVVGMERVSGGTLIYNSYGEWLESPYSDPETGVTCQGCHMPASDANWFVFPEHGGITRDYITLSNHTMLGAADETFLQNAVSMNTAADWVDDQLHVQVSITNDKTGHHIPTDAPIRSMILIVEVTDANGELLTLLEGPVNPDFSGDYGGLPGKTFAKVLRDDWTGETPTGAYWRPVTIVEDTRLAALATDTTQYIYDAPAGTEITVNVRLVFRRAFYEIMRQKGWDDPDILMKQETLQVFTD